MPKKQTPAKKRSVSRRTNNKGTMEKRAKADPAVNIPPPPDPPKMKKPSIPSIPAVEDNDDNGDVSTEPQSSSLTGTFSVGRGPDDEHVEFDVWMEAHGPIVENRPDDFYFAVVRKYPKLDAKGNPIGGVVLRLKQPFNEAWLSEALPDGGRYTVELKGPTKKPGYTNLKSTYAAYHNLELPMRGMARPPDESLPPFPGEVEDEIDDEEEDEFEEPSLPQENPFFTRIADNYFSQTARDERELRELRRQTMRAPQPRQESAADKIMLKLVDSMNKPPVTDDTAREEVAKLHGLINKLNETYSREKIETLAANREDIEKRLSEQRKSYELMIKETAESHQKSYDRQASQHQTEMQNLREGYADRSQTLRDQLADVKQELRDARSEGREEVRSLQAKVDQLTTELAMARNEAATSKSEYAALVVTKKSELDTKVAQIQMQEMTRARDEERARILEEKKKVEDPIESMVNRIEQAKSLASTLGAKLGVGGSDDAPAPQSKFDKIVDVGLKIAGSKEARQLASGAIESAARGVGTILKAREEAKTTSTPSTSAIMNAWQNGQIQQPPPAPDPAPVPNPAPPQPSSVQNPGEDLRQATLAPQNVEYAPPPNTSTNTVIDVVESVADAMPDVDMVTKKGEDLLDNVENHSLLGTPVEEAAEEMISELIELSGAPRVLILANFVDATAIKTLEELGHTSERMSPGALNYMDRLIQYGAEKHKEEAQ